MLRSAKHRALVAQLPVKRLLTETDGPFVLAECAPVRLLAVAKTVAELASLMGVSVSHIQAQILENLSTLVSK